MATKEPWNNEIYQAMKENPAELNRKSRNQSEGSPKRPLTSRFLTFLVVLFFIIVGLLLAFILWNGAMMSSKPINAFNDSSSIKASQAQKASASQAAKTSQSSAATSASSSSSSATSSSSSQTSESSSSSSAASGSTYTIQSGDTPNSIASKTGVAWSTIASLNNISASGYNADGSAIYAGQVIKLK